MVDFLNHCWPFSLLFTFFGSSFFFRKDDFGANAINSDPTNLQHPLGGLTLTRRVIEVFAAEIWKPAGQFPEGLVFPMHFLEGLGNLRGNLKILGMIPIIKQKSLEYSKHWEIHGDIYL